MSSIAAETVSTGVAEDRLSSDLLRDFYQTFRLSQAEAAVQPPLFTRLAHLHQAAGNTSILPAALKLADSAVDRMMPPTRHAQTDIASLSDPSTGFRAMWKDYAEVLLDPSMGRVKLDEDVLDDMLVKDIVYQEKPRPSAKAGGDQHESIVREYILGSALTGSEQLLQVRANLKNSLLNPSEENGEYMVNRLHYLVAEWETNHPGQSFMLSAYDVAGSRTEPRQY